MDFAGSRRVKVSDKAVARAKACRPLGWALLLDQEDLGDKSAEVSGEEWPLSDMGNAERLVHYYGSEFRHSRALGWLAWDGRRWAHDDEGHVWRLAKATVRRILEEGKTEAKREMGQEL